MLTLHLRICVFEWCVQTTGIKELALNSSTKKMIIILIDLRIEYLTKLIIKYESKVKVFQTICNRFFNAVAS